MISVTFLISFFFSSVISFTAGGVTKVDINRQPLNMSEANEIICALKHKLSVCDELLRENRWPLLVRAEIDRIFDRYGEGISITKEDVHRMMTVNVDSKVRRMSKTILCERMFELNRYYEGLSRLRERIEKAHQCDEEITIKSFCEAIGDVYDWISENDAPYLRLHAGEAMPRVVNMLTDDKVNKYVNILMENANVPPLKKHTPKGNKGANSTMVANQEQLNVTTTVMTSVASEATTVSAGKKNEGTTTC